MNTYDGLNEATYVNKTEITQISNLTNTLIEMDGAHQEIINLLILISNHLFGEIDKPTTSNDSSCFAEQLEKNLKMTNMILGCVKSMADKIGAS